MLGFGKKKDDDDKEKAEQAQIGQAMRSMSDQIASQAQKIKQLEEELDDAKEQAGDNDEATSKLKDAQAELRKMKIEMARVKAEAAKNAAEAAKSGAAEQASELGIGVTKIGPKTDSPAETPVGGLQIGGMAYVQKAGGKNLRRRSAPGLDSDVIDGLAPGTQLTLLAGPVEDDGYPWWQIRTGDGREGWVAGTELVTEAE
ncbi:MAG: SH3 domain-containing protein [Oscillochloris sp.]|nr:SH3 domain-containing protein [Oscillochloris sp.]